MAVDGFTVNGELSVSHVEQPDLRGADEGSRLARSREPDLAELLMIDAGVRDAISAVAVLR